MSYVDAWGVDLAYMGNPWIYLGCNASPYYLKTGGRITGDAFIYAYDTGAGNLGIGTLTPLQRLDVRGFAYMSGGVGIGTLTPQQPLDVRGNGHISGNIGIGTTIPLATLHVQNLGAYDCVRIEDSSTLDPSPFVINQTGNVGIGRAVPASKLTVSGGGMSVGIGYSAVSAPTDSIIVAGNIGIGTSVPQASLHVQNVGAYDCFRVDDVLGDTTPFVVKENGNVGIGTTNPEEKLHIDGNVRALGNCYLGTSTANADGNVIAFYGTNADNQEPYKMTFLGEFLYSGEERSELALFKGNDYDTGAGYDRIRVIAPQVQLSTYNQDVLPPYDQSYSNIIANPNILPRFTVMPDGNIGIGTAEPLQLLHVEGIAYLSSNVGIGTTVPLQPLHVTGQSYFASNVGIGTATPLQSLHVVGQGYFTSNLGIGTATPLQPLHVEGVSYFASNVGVGTNAPLQPLHVVGQGYLTSNLGIGTATPLQSLHVVGQSYFTSNVGIGTETPLQPLHVVGQGYFTSNVGIGTATPLQPLHVQGDALLDARVPSWASYRSTSNVGWTSSNLLLPVSHGTVNGVNLTALNQRTRTSYAVSTSAVSTWAQRSSANDSLNWQAVCWSPERSLFCAVSYSGTLNRVMTSPDGLTWTSRTTPASEPWLIDVCWSPQLSIFCAVAYYVAPGGSTTPTAYTSPDGITWTERSLPYRSWTSICWSPELSLFCAVGWQGTQDSIGTSSDGINWTLRNSPINGSFYNTYNSVCWSAELGLFCAVSKTSGGVGNRVMTSPDGINWTLRPTPTDNDWTSVCWSPELGLFCAVSITGTGNRVMTSSDGFNWTLRTSPADNNWQTVCWSPELSIFCAVAYSGTGNRIMSSHDGIVWTTRSSPANNDWYSICWSPELSIFASVAGGGTGGRVMTNTAVIPAPDSCVLANPSQVTVNQLTGLVGIGTTNPLTKLHVQGQGRFVQEGGAVRLESTAGGHTYMEHYLAGTRKAYVGFGNAGSVVYTIANESGTTSSARIVLNNVDSFQMERKRFRIGRSAFPSITEFSGIYMKTSDGWATAPVGIPGTIITLATLCDPGTTGINLTGILTIHGDGDSKVIVEEWYLRKTYGTNISITRTHTWSTGFTTFTVGTSGNNITLQSDVDTLYSWIFKGSY